MPKRSEIAFDGNTAQRAEVREKRYEIWDSQRPGLLLRILPTGKKNWYVALDRKSLRKLGDARVMTLSAAWTLAKQKQGKHLSGEKVKSSRSEAPILKDYLDKKYLAYAVANQKRGNESVARLKSACAPLLDTRLDKLSEFEIEKWKAARLDSATPSTVKRDFTALRSALYKAVAWGIIETNPAARVKVKTPKDERVRYLEEDERKRLLKALRARDKQKAEARTSGNVHALQRGREPLPEIRGYADYLTPLILLVMNTGLRRGEALALCWSDVRLTGDPRITIRASTSKGDTTAHIPLNSEAVAVLKRWKAQGEGKGLVFAHRVTGNQLEEIKPSWKNLMTKAKITDFRFHDLRHDFASRLVMAGVDLYRVKDLMRHSTIQMTERYAHLAPKALADAVEVLV